MNSPSLWRCFGRGGLQTACGRVQGACSTQRSAPVMLQLGSDRVPQRWIIRRGVDQYYGSLDLVPLVLSADVLRRGGARLRRSCRHGVWRGGVGGLGGRSWLPTGEGPLGGRRVGWRRTGRYLSMTDRCVQ